LRASWWKTIRATHRWANSSARRLKSIADLPSAAVVVRGNTQRLGDHDMTAKLIATRGVIKDYFV
jgi:hypothetical protein